MIQPSAISELLVPLSDLLVAATCLGVFAVAMRRDNIPATRRRRVLYAAAALFAAWYGVVAYLAARGVFLVTPQARAPALPIAVLLPLIVSLPLLLRSRFIASALDATPLSYLVGAQVLRVMGAIFLVEWAFGALPGVFALPAGLGDMATGVIAAPLAVYCAKNATQAAKPVLAWTALGLADFACAMATGFLSSPGKFQLLALDQPNLIGAAYPLALIPAFGVPTFIILHVLTLWKLRRQSSQTAATRLLAHPA